MGERVSGLLGAYVAPGRPSEWSLDCDAPGLEERLVVQWPSTWVVDGFDNYLIRDAGGERMARSRDRLVFTGDTRPASVGVPLSGHFRVEVQSNYRADRL